MPRKPRIHYPSAVYHVMLRGNGGQDIFFESSDRIRFLLLMQQAVERYGCRIHAYCLMDNHLHLAIQVGETSLSTIMQNIGFRYTQYINRKKKRSGHLFQGRFKALLIDESGYLLELVRYIHLNPLRAGMVTDVESYEWSSHKDYLEERAAQCLTTDWVLGQFGSESPEAKRRYRAYLLAGIEEGHRKEFHRGSCEGRILGDDDFAERVLTQAEECSGVVMSIEVILDAVCREYSIDLAELSVKGRQQPYAEARAVSAWLVRRSERLELAELTKFLNRDISTLSKAANRVGGRLRNDDQLKDRIEAVEVKMGNSSVSQA